MMKKRLSIKRRTGWVLLLLFGIAAGAVHAQDLADRESYDSDGTAQDLYGGSTNLD
mgnify:CR=1 FL=1